MKKLMLSLVVVTLSVAQVEAKSSFLETVKVIPTQVKVAAAYALSCVRDSNAVKIEKALEAKKAIEGIRLSLHASANVEEQLLQNVQALGFSKINALMALKKIEKHCAAMQSVINRYTSALTPWNKSEVMATVVAELSPFLQVCNSYSNYFSSHKDCLKAWELVERFTDINSVEITDKEAAFKAIFSWYKSSDAFSLIVGVEKLNADIKFIKSCLLGESFASQYPMLHKQLIGYVIVLDAIVTHIITSREYNREYFYKNHKSSPSSKVEEANVSKNDTVTSAVLAQSSSADINHEKMIRRTDPFGNNPY